MRTQPNAEEERTPPEEGAGGSTEATGEESGEQEPDDTGGARCEASEDTDVEAGKIVQGTESELG